MTDLPLHTRKRDLDMSKPLFIDGSFSCINCLYPPATDHDNHDEKDHEVGQTLPWRQKLSWHAMVNVLTELSSSDVLQEHNLK